MTRILQSLALPVLLALEPERAHALAVTALKTMPLPAAGRDDPRLAVEAFGLTFANPVGMAAGFDKNAEVADALIRLGFGFVEVGTVTPRPQAGNRRPRVFRLIHDLGLINRLGFNNEGYAAAHARLVERLGRPGIVGVNIGANKGSADRVADYVTGIACFADVASYITLNISSPNTPGLRDLQHVVALDELLARVIDARDHLGDRRTRRPVLLKIAPDLSLADLDDTVHVARKRRVDGMIVSNTTITRPSTLRDGSTAAQLGGLSGRPLFELSTRMLAATYVRVDKQFPLVGVGGIDGVDAAYEKIRAGATLLQLYSAIVFRGPHLIEEIKRGLTEKLSRSGYARLTEAIGATAAAWAGA